MAKIDLTWNAPASTGGSADSYSIWRKEGQHTSATTISNAPDSGWPKSVNHSGAASAAQSYPDETVTFGKHYSYTIKAVNDKGSSANFSTPDNAKA